MSSSIVKNKKINFFQIYNHYGIISQSSVLKFGKINFKLLNVERVVKSLEVIYLY